MGTVGLSLSTSLFLLLSGCGDGSKKAFVGTWVVDKQATLQMMHESPEWRTLNKAQRRYYDARLPENMKAMQLRITADAMEYITGAETLRFAYEIDAISPREMTATGDLGGQPVTLHLFLEQAERLRVQSEHSYELDYYVWRRARK